MTTPEQRAIKHLSTRLLIIESALEFLLTALQRTAPQEIEAHLSALREARAAEPGHAPVHAEVIEASIELLEDAASRAAGRPAVHSPFQR